MEKFNKVVTFVKSHIPGLGVKYKNDSFLMKLLGVLIWPFNHRFMEDFTTTLKWTVYFPSKEFIEKDPDRAIMILLHEFVHLWDRKEKGVIFSLLYLLPQVGAALPLMLLLGIGWFAPWWVSLILGLLVVLLLLPWPALWRARWEMRGYTMNLAYAYWVLGTTIDSEFIKEQFIGWNYYKMWPFEKDVQAHINLAKEAIRQNTLDKPYRLAKNFIKEELCP